MAPWILGDGSSHLEAELTVELRCLEIIASLAQFGDTPAGRPLVSTVRISRVP